MNAEEFVLVIKQVVEKAAIDDLISSLNATNEYPVDKKLARMLEWYSSLNAEGRAMIMDLISESVQSTLFGFFCVLDGVRAIENGPEKGRLELVFSKGDTRTVLNDGELDFLHDLYQS